MNKKIFVYSFFSGAGFLDFGFEKSGVKICFANEIHKPFLDAYKYSRKMLGIVSPEDGFANDDIGEYLSGKKLSFIVNAVKKKRKHGYVGFIGGPPCPDFSVGGKNKGRYGDNGRLSSTYIDLLTKAKPDFFLFENVKGLWRTKKHKQFFDEIKRRAQNSGYWTTERLINAIEYGVPQDRERIILMGFSRNVLEDKGIKTNRSCLRELAKEMFPWEKTIVHQKEKVFDLPWPKTIKFRQENELAPPEGIDQKLTVQHWFKKNKVEEHPNARHCFRPKAGIVRFAEVPEGDDSRKSFKRLHRWRYSPTACYGNNEVHLHPYKVRRINVAEALAIQSLPKEFLLPEDMTLTDMFKTTGNGVPYLAAKGLAKSVTIFLGEK